MSKTYEYSTLEKKYNDLKRDFDYQNTIVQELMDKYSDDGKLKNLGICIELYYKQEKRFTVEEIRERINKISYFDEHNMENVFVKELLAEFQKEIK